MDEHITANDVVQAVIEMALQSANCGICSGSDPDALPHEEDYHHKGSCPVPLAIMVRDNLVDGEVA